VVTREGREMLTLDGSESHEEGQRLAAGWQHLAVCWQQASAGLRKFPQDTASPRRTQASTCRHQQALRLEMSFNLNRSSVTAMFLFSKIALSSKFVFMTIVEKKGVCELIKFKEIGPSTQQQRRETIEALISLPRV
jgi:hypothetical protein